MTQDSSTSWPTLSASAGDDTRRTLHMWSQIIGKTRLALSPMTNHWWHIPLYVTARGLTTSPMPYGLRVIEVELDLIDHRLELRSSDGGLDGFPLHTDTLAAFHRRFFDGLRKLDVDVHIYPVAVEIEDTIYLDRDDRLRNYDPDWAQRFHIALIEADRLLKQFRADFLGKASPVHFFWGSADLAVTRFSGRTAPLHPGGAPHCPDRVMQEAYSHECSSAGFWPGGPGLNEGAFYSYAYPEPEGFAEASVAPQAARYDHALREFVLPYEHVRNASSPDELVSEFLQSTYTAAAQLGRWERSSLERHV